MSLTSCFHCFHQKCNEKLHRGSDIACPDVACLHRPLATEPALHVDVSSSPYGGSVVNNTLDNLPTEVLDLIFEKISNRKDLKRLCEVSSLFYNVAIPHLYRAIHIKAKHESTIYETNAENLLQIGSRPRSHLQHVKKVTVFSMIQKDISRTRCVHAYATNGLWTPKLQELEENLMPLFLRLKDDALREFRWIMGICVPRGILGPSGYLSIKQKALESLMLVTGGNCPSGPFPQTRMNLSNFKSLRQLIWINLRSYCDLLELEKLLQANSKRLTSLELDLVDWDEVEESWFDGHDEVEDEPEDDAVLPDDNFFAYHILHLSAKGHATTFPALQKLSLGDISFQSATKEMASLFNFSQLKSLTLHRCTCTDAFLRDVVDSGQAIALTSLEITFCFGDFELGYDVEMLARYLKAFKGLQEIYLRVPAPTDPIQVWRAVYPHRSTLKRLVYHQTEFDTDPNSPRFEELCDDLSLTINELKALDEHRHPFANINLENIGLSLNASQIRPALKPFINKLSLKCLHIRRSGNEIPNIEWISEYNRWKSSQDVLNLADDIEPWPAETTPGNNGNGTLSNDTPASPSTTDSDDEDSFSSCATDVFRFAKWAFGLEGIHSLQIMGYGDFSLNGRFWESAIILFRDSAASNGFRPPGPSDGTRMDELFVGNIDFFATCPAYPILGRRSEWSGETSWP